MSEAQIIKTFKALSVTSRIQIIKLISKRKLCVNVLAVRLGITPSAVSQHLKILKKCHLVHAECYGSITHYKLNKEIMRDFSVAVGNLFTGSQEQWKQSLKSKT
ncbi:MAG TPA: transcriptional regulator [Bacteroidetes bacterium]|nr:transcriptional regulator [Bacteroidota bacterium]